MSTALQLKKPSVLPGFGPALGYTVFYLSAIVLLPLAALLAKAAGLGWSEFWEVISSPRVVAAYELTFGASAIAAVLNLFFGFILAWTLVRYTFPGKKIVDAVIDLPFALPTAVSGIALTAVYSRNGWVGQYLEPAGFQVAYAPPGIVLALTFIGLPFVVRTLQPAFEDLDHEIEEAAASLGATRWRTFTRVIVPTVLPALLTGFALSFARAVGEYGSVVFISGNIPMRTEIVPLLIVTKLENYDYAGATALGASALGISFVILFLINVTQWLAARRQHRA